MKQTCDGRAEASVFEPCAGIGSDLERLSVRSRSKFRRLGSTSGAVIASLALATLLARPVAADGLITRHRMPAHVAILGVTEAIAACTQRGFHTSAAVVDPDGNLQAVIRGDGAGVQTVQSALDKANTSAVYGVDSGTFVDQADKGQHISPLLNHLPHLLLAKGGVTVKIDGEVIAAIAIGGTPSGETDEACARVGLDAILKALK